MSTRQHCQCCSPRSAQLGTWPACACPVSEVDAALLGGLGRRRPPDPPSCASSSTACAAPGWHSPSSSSSRSMPVAVAAAGDLDRSLRSSCYGTSIERPSGRGAGADMGVMAGASQTTSSVHNTPGNLRLLTIIIPARSYKQDFLSRGIPRFYALDLEPKRGIRNVSGPVIYHRCVL